MMDDTIPFPAAEEPAEKKPRRRRGGARRRHGRPAGGEEPRNAADVPGPIPIPLPAPASPASPVSMGALPPTRSALEQRLALFIDFENIALGVRDAKYKKFDIHLVLQRLIEKGRIVYKKAYADWTRYG